jgi:hypothetical protein
MAVASAAVAIQIAICEVLFMLFSFSLNVSGTAYIEYRNDMVNTLPRKSRGSVGPGSDFSL